MTSAGTDGQRKARITLAVLAAATTVLVAAVAILIYALLREPPGTTASPNPPTPSPQSSAPAELTWQPIAGVELPVSRTHGPRSTEDGGASGFSDSELGAALAAVHILVRTGANVGPDIYEPTITQQVTGTNAAAMKVLTDQQYRELRATAGVEDGDPLPSGNAEVLGYRIAAFADDTATVEVVTTAPDLAGQVLTFDVTLQRTDNDWQVVAPPRGDWGAVATTLSAAPEGMLRYDETG